MAGLDWFELDVDMPDDPKCDGLAARLKNPLAFGYVVRIYAHCYRYAQDRFDGPGAPTTIEKAAHWRGRTGALVAALLEERFLDREGEALVVHGVSDRLAPHLAKKERDAQRARERRANVAATIGRTSPGRREDVSGDTDRDRDSDRSEITTAADHRDAAGGGDDGLSGLRKKLGEALGLPRIGIGKDAPRVVASFRRWLATAGEDETIAECVRIAREKSVTPGHLSWWAGWLDTASDEDLERVAWRRAGGMS